MGSGMPDYSEWLTPARLAETEQAWAKMDRSELIAAIMKHHPKTVFEFCCGTGWIPFDLPLDVEYEAIDANEGCIGLAMKKNPTRRFGVQDVREFAGIEPVDMALAFSCLKHFSLEEWDGIYSKVLQAGKRTLTSIYLHAHNKEDPGHGFPHVAVTHERMERVIKENGHRLVQVFTLPPLNKHPEPLVLTERVDDAVDLVAREGLGQSSDGGGVLLREGVLGGVSGEAGDSSGEDPDSDAEEHGPSPLGTKEWPL